MYARGMSVREILGFIAEHYGTQFSRDFVRGIIGEVMAETGVWHGRPLEPMNPVVYFGALRVKVRGDGVVGDKAV